MPSNPPVPSAPDESSEPPDTTTRAPVPGSIFSVAHELPLIVFDERGRALIDFEAAAGESPTVYLSPTDLPRLRTYMRRHLSAITTSDDIPAADAAWAIFRVLLNEASALFREISGRVSTVEVLAILRLALDFQIRNQGDFPYVDVFFQTPYTPVTHAVETALTATALGAADGRTGEEELLPIALGGFFADIAKLNLPPEMLTRDGPLSASEWRLMRQHPLRSAEIMHRAGIINPTALRAAISHHERLDGSGYPDMLRGEDIPIEARYVAIADVFSAMTVDRAFRARIDSFQALGEMAANGGGGLDPSLLRTFVQLLASRHAEASSDETRGGATRAA